MNHSGSSEHGQQRRSGPFDVHEDAALDALEVAWGAEYDEFWVYAGEWGAHRSGAPKDDVLTGATPDELDRAIRADQSRRAAL
jgi:hypothetical protein